MKKITIISIMVFAFLTLTKSASAQTQDLYYNYSNTSNCSWDIYFYDNSMNILHSYTIAAGSSGSSTCAISIAASVSFIRLYETGGCSSPLFGNCSSGCQLLNISPSYCGYNCSIFSPTQSITIYSIPACQPNPPQQAYDIIIVP